MKEATHERPRTVWFHLYKISRTSKPVKTEIALTNGCLTSARLRPGGEGRGVVRNDWVPAFFLGLWNSSKIDCSDVCVTLDLCTLSGWIVRRVDYILIDWIFLQKEKQCFVKAEWIFIPLRYCWERQIGYDFQHQEGRPRLWQRSESPLRRKRKWWLRGDGGHGQHVRVSSYRRSRRRAVAGSQSMAVIIVFKMRGAESCCYAHVSNSIMKNELRIERVSGSCRKAKAASAASKQKEMFLPLKRVQTQAAWGSCCWKMRDVLSGCT